MGTNYYAVPKPCSSPCDHCAQEPVHIGKSLVMFRAYPWGIFGDDDPILSWRAWRDTLRFNSSCVRNEYGEDIPLADFIAEVQATSRERRERQYRWMVDNALDSGDDDFLDIDGFSFCRREFS